MCQLLILINFLARLTSGEKTHNLLLISLQDSDNAQVTKKSIIWKVLNIIIPNNPIENN